MKNSGYDGYELRFVRPGRIHRRFARRDRVSAPATGQTSQLIIEFSLLNAVGSLLIILSLIFKFNASASLIEVFWFLISLIGLSKWLAARKRLRVKADERTI
jgi:hypothetical protein